MYHQYHLDLNFNQISGGLKFCKHVPNQRQPLLLLTCVHYNIVAALRVVLLISGISLNCPTVATQPER